MTDTPEPKSEFDAAKAIVGELKGFQQEQQDRILRWVAESLKLAMRAQPLASPSPSWNDQDVQEPTSGAKPGDTEPPARQGDIKTFVAAKAPRSDIQFATVVAYYYRFEAPQQKDTIDAETLQDATRLVNRERLTKPHLTRNNAKNQGYLDSVSRGIFRINAVGENLVSMALPGNDAMKRRATPRKEAREKVASRRRR
jgi:hypothetical protein